MSEGRNVLYKCRLQGRLFCLLLCVLAGLVSQAQSPATTTISDTVYRADGTPAAGTLLISWPTFSTASGQAVASGTKSVTLGTGGALSVALVPNAGAAPANTFYTVVYQLSDGTVKTEFWSVGTTSPTTIAAVRTTLGSGSSAAHPGTKQYVDTGLVVKANIINGVVPSGQLGNGTANSTVCLHGDSSWGGCGTSSNAVSIQTVPVDTASPTDNQVITYVASLGKYQPRAGGGVTAGMQAVKYAPDFDWSQSPSADLSTAGPQTVNLAVCPAAVSGSEAQYYVYISGAGTPEAVLVTGGTCAGNGQA